MSALRPIAVATGATVHHGTLLREFDEFEGGAEKKRRFLPRGERQIIPISIYSLSEWSIDFLMDPFRFDALSRLNQDLNRRLQKPACLAGPRNRFARRGSVH
jgi:hypothetical protein